MPAAVGEKTVDCPGRVHLGGHEGVSRAAYAVIRFRHVDQGRTELLDVFRVEGRLAAMVSCSR